MSAEAAAAEGRIALDQQIIAQLPQLIAAAADGLSGPNLTVLNGAAGLNDVASSLASQGIAILNALRDGLGVPAQPQGEVVHSNGSRPQPDPSDAGS